VEKEGVLQETVSELPPRLVSMELDHVSLFCANDQGHPIVTRACEREAVFTRWEDDGHFVENRRGGALVIALSDDKKTAELRFPPSHESSWFRGRSLTFPVGENDFFDYQGRLAVPSLRSTQLVHINQRDFVKQPDGWLVSASEGRAAAVISPEGKVWIGPEPHKAPSQPRPPRREPPGLLPISREPDPIVGEEKKLRMFIGSEGLTEEIPNYDWQLVASLVKATREKKKLVWKGRVVEKVISDCWSEESRVREVYCSMPGGRLKHALEVTLPGNCFTRLAANKPFVHQTRQIKRQGKQWVESCYLHRPPSISQEDPAIAFLDGDVEIYFSEDRLARADPDQRIAAWDRFKKEAS
jgi:hypothetical protein